MLSAGLMPTEARGNYLPEAPYLRETKTYLNYMHASESTLDIGTSGTASHSSPDINTAHFIFFVADVMSNYLTTDGLNKFSLLPEDPWGLRPVAFATSATWLIRHWRCYSSAIYDVIVCLYVCLSVTSRYCIKADGRSRKQRWYGKIPQYGGVFKVTRLLTTLGKGY